MWKTPEPQRCSSPILSHARVLPRDQGMSSMQWTSEKHYGVLVIKFFHALVRQQEN